MPKQATLFGVKRKEKVLPRWTRPGAWHPAPGEITCGANDMLDLLARARVAGLHVMRVNVVTNPCQGYRLLIVSGGYKILPEVRAAAGGLIEIAKPAAASDTEEEDYIPFSWPTR